MTMLNLLSTLAILMGAGVLCVAFRRTGRLLLELGGRAYTRDWSTLRALMLVFVLSYVGAAFVIIEGHADALRSIVGFVFIGGALFVYLVTRTSDRTIRALDHTSVSRDALTSILDAIGDGLLVLDRDGRILMCNRALEGMQGARRADLVGTSVAGLLDMTPAQLGPFLAGDEHCRVTTKLRTVWGIMIPVALSRSRPDKFDGVVLVAQDRSEQRDAEEELNAARELVESNASECVRYFQIVKAELESVLSEYDPWAAGGDSKRDDPAQAVAALRRVVGDIDALARASARAQRIRPRTFALRELVASALRAVRARAEAHGVSLELRVEADTPETITSSARQLHRVLIAVLSDMIKWSAGGSLTVSISRPSTTRESPEVMFEVRGSGSPPRSGAGATIYGDVRESLTDIGRGLVRALGGRVWTQRRGAGYSHFFTITDVTARVTEDASGAREPLASRRVWIVGDSEREYDVIVASCTAWNMATTMFASGEAALSALEIRRPDVVIVDSGTSDIRGVEFVQRAEARLEALDVPLILMGEAVKTSLLYATSGFAALLQKPARRPALEMVLEGVLPERPGGDEASRRSERGASSVEEANERSSGALEGSSISAVASSEDGVEFLIVDSSAASRELLVGYLRRLGLRPSIATGGREAIAALERRSFDAVLLDLETPDISGFSVLRWIRARPELADMPVLMISAVEDVDSIARCIELGADDFLPKPLNPPLLRARIESCLEKQRRAREDRAHLIALGEASRRSD